MKTVDRRVESSAPQPPASLARLLRMASAPPTAAPAFEAAVVSEDDIVYTSGQLPLINGELAAAGLVGSDVSLDVAARAARICTANALAAVNAVAGERRIERIVKLMGFVASSPGFHDQPAVMNGASALLHEVLGTAGRHARSAIGVSSLPRNAPVEVELIVKLARD